MSSMLDILTDYYETRKLKTPNFEDAMMFLHTEIGEVYELRLALKNYVRNNPHTKPTYSGNALAEELGDVIMMAIVAGMVEGVDPLKALIHKLSKKANKTYILSEIPWK